jgi:hypothetical protein
MLLSGLLTIEAEAAITVSGTSTAYYQSATLYTAGTISVVGVGTLAAAASGNVSAALPTGIAANDVLLCIVESHDNVAPTFPAGWTRLYRNRPGSEYGTAWYKIATASETNPTVTHTAGNSIIAQCSAYRNALQAAPNVSGVAGTGANVNSGSGITTTVVNELLLMASHLNQGATTPTTGWSMSVTGGLTWTQQFASTTTSLGLGSSIGLFSATKATAGAQTAVRTTIAGTVNAATLNYGTLIELRPGLVITKPAGTLSGDLMLLSIAARSSTATITPPSGWTLLLTTTNGTNTRSMLKTYYKIAGAVEPTSYAWSSGTTESVASLVSFSGVDPTTPFDGVTPLGQANASALTQAAPSITPASANDLLVTVHEIASTPCALNRTNGWTPLPPTGSMIEQTDICSRTPATTNGISMEVAALALTTGATGIKTATAAANAARGIGQSIVLRPLAVATLNHIQINHDGIGQTCRAEVLTVTACANALCTTPHFNSATVTGNVAWAGSPGGSLAFTIASGSSGQTTVLLPVTSAQTVTLSTNTISPTETNPPSTYVNSSGGTANQIIFSSASNCFDAVEVGAALSTNIFTKLAGRSFSLDVLAESAYSGTLQVELVNSSTGSCATYASLSPTQNTTVPGQMRNTLSFTYANAAQNVKVRIKGLADFSCSSDRFSIRPAAFLVVQNTPNLNAGSTFTLSASAVANDLTTVTTNYTLVPALNVSQITGTPGFTSAALSLQPPGFLTSAGVSSGTFTYDDVGSFTLPATSPNIYGISDSAFTSIVDSGDCVPGSASNTPDVTGKFGCLIGQSAALTVGSFHPDHFDMSPAFAAGCASGSFTYMDQPFVLDYSVAAMSYNNVQLEHYTGGNINIAAVNGSTDLTTRLSTVNPPPTWSNGIYAQSGTSYTFTRPISTTADTTWGAFDTLDIGVAIDDPDGIGYPGGTSTFTMTTPASCIKSGATECRKYASLTGGAQTKMRYGRLHLSNAFGSEKLWLPVPAQIEYYNSKWQINTADNCTTFATLSGPPSALPLYSPTGVLLPTTMTTPWCGVSATATVCDATSGFACDGTTAVTNGRLGLCLTAPTAPVAGYVDVPFDLTIPTYLQFNSVPNPTTRAGFGLYNQSGNAKKIIFRQEVR